MSLYQKYRPKDFSSLVGQEFVKIALKNALSKGKTVGAYLFYGSRGTGKTTVARILAKSVNCLDLKEDGNPCLECTNCKAFENDEMMDIIEIDAASNTGVDNIRDLIERAQFQPTSGKFKIYIIDEVHMLSKGAFNALLKTLEEPPSHVKFILATTEIHKIPDTIISRTQRYDFKRISENDIVERLKFIGHSEEINAEEEALKLISRLSKGGLRDAIAFFEQYSIGGSLKLDYLKSNLQLVGDEFLIEFSENLISRNKINILQNIDFLQTKGIDVRIFIEEITFFIHNKIVDNIDNKSIFVSYMELYDTFIEIYSKLKSVPNTFMLLEYSLLKFLVGENIKKSQFDIIEPAKTLKKEEIKAQVAQKTPEVISASEKQLPVEKNEIKFVVKESKNEVVETHEELPSIQKDAKKEMKGRFEISAFLDSMKNDKGKGFVVMSLKSSVLKMEDNKLSIIVNNAFNYNKLSTNEIASYLAKKVEELYAIEPQIKIELNEGGF